MKKKMIDYVKELGGSCTYSGKTWPSVLYLTHRNGKDWIIREMIKRFTRHTQIKFL